MSQLAYSQTDYEEYLIVETNTNTEQGLSQKNVGSGESINVNCGTNTAGTNLVQPINCPNVPGDVPGETPTLIPVVTQRSVTELKTGGGIYSVEAPCNSDEVVTGGGYDVSGFDAFRSSDVVIKEFAVNNAWHIETPNFGSPPATEGTLTAFAECLKLVPAS